VRLYVVYSIGLPPEISGRRRLPAWTKPPSRFVSERFPTGNFRLFRLGQGICSSDLMQAVALGWLGARDHQLAVRRRPDSGVPLSGVLLFTVYAGVIVDRVDKRRLSCGRRRCRWLEALALACSCGPAGHDVAGHGAGAFFGVGNAFDIRRSVHRGAVGKEDLMNAIALNSSCSTPRDRSAGRRGRADRVAGVGMCFFLNGVSYVAVIAGLLAMGSRRS